MKHSKKMTVLAASLVSTAAVTAGVVTAGGATAAPAAKDALGIDVSNHNGTVDFKAVKGDGRDFAFVLASDGNSFTSPEYKTQYKGAGDAGLIRGAYHFGRPGGSASGQADHFLAAADYSNDGKSLPPVLDLEANPNGGACYGLGAAEMKTWIKGFLTQVKEKTKRDAIIYTSPGFWKDCTGNSKEFAENPVWIANWGVDSPEVPGGWKSYTFWQYSDSGQVKGVNGPVDVNRFNGTVADLEKLAKG